MSYDPYRPSNLRTTELCPGSARLCASVNEPPASDDADKGAELHALVPPEMSLEHLSVADREIVEECREIVRSYETDESVTYYECELEVEGISKGTADVVIVRENDVVVIDWKFGWNPVEENNLQVATYALLAMELYRRPTAVIVLWAPRTMYVPATFHFTIREDAAMTSQRIARIRGATERDGLLLVPSEQACRYCPAKAICPAIRLEALERVEQGDITIADDQMRNYWEAAGMAEKWAKSIKAQIKSMVLAAESVDIPPPPGMKVTKTKGDRYVDDPQRVFDTISHRLTIDQFLAMCHVKVTELEEMYARQRKEEGVTLVDAKKEFTELMGDLIKRGRGSLRVSLAPLPVEEPEPQPQAIGE